MTRDRTCHRLAAIGIILSGFAAVPGFAADLAGGASSCLIEPNQLVRLKTEAQGVLAEVLAKRGDHVATGDVMARLESGVERAVYEAARVRAASVALLGEKQAVAVAADAALERKSRLASKDFSSQQDLEKARMDAAVAHAQVEAAELDLRLAKIEAERTAAVLERRMVRAPVAGVVTAVDAHVGEYADPTVAIVTLAAIDPLRVEVYFPLSAYRSVTVGQHATIRPEAAIGGEYAAVVATKDAHIDAASGLFLVQLDLPNPDGAIPSGIHCDVSLK